MSWRSLTKQESLQLADVPPNPRELDCARCDTVIGDEDWDWAAMPGNGPVHTRCFMTDEQLLAELSQGPCTGCDTSCDKYNECADVEVTNFANGIDNCIIVRPGPELDHIAEQYRAAGYKVVH